MPGKSGDVAAFSCTSAGVARGSVAGTRRCPANVKPEAMAGRVVISCRSWSSTERHSTRMAEIEGVRNSSA
ncbi:hypothetical protein ACVWY2_001048 [Bradyrhizobium sp. JR6.1]